MSMRPIAVSCGEPAGIGPEIAVKAWDALRDAIPMFWVGDPRHLPAHTLYRVISDPSDAGTIGKSELPVLVQEFADVATPGSPNLHNAQGVVDAIATCVSLAQNGAAAGLVTAPIHKSVLMDGADFAYPGHTEYLQALTGADHAVMMLASETLRVVPTTIHIALHEVASVLTPDLLRMTLRVTEQSLREQFHIASPRIAVAGLNPHAGEGGAMGHQEEAWIKDLVAEMAGNGMNLIGPMPADTMFHAAARAQYDAAVCMYHDQALIPIKTLDFDKGVNVTLGLPIIRTSPDHGTAFDIAGRGTANPTSMIEAIKMAAAMAQGR